MKDRETKFNDRTRGNQVQDETVITNDHFNIFKRANSQIRKCCYETGNQETKWHANLAIGQFYKGISIKHMHSHANYLIWYLSKVIALQKTYIIYVFSKPTITADFVPVIARRHSDLHEGTLLRYFSCMGHSAFPRLFIEPFANNLMFKRPS